MACFSNNPRDIRGPTFKTIFLTTFVFETLALALWPSFVVSGDSFVPFKSSLLFLNAFAIEPKKKGRIFYKFISGIMSLYILFFLLLKFFCIKKKKKSPKIWHFILHHFSHCASTTPTIMLLIISFRFKFVRVDFIQPQSFEQYKGSVNHSL